MAEHEIRADYDKQSIVIYQAYRENIALPALQANKFVAPFSLNRMTWIKPSFLWLMHRSNWGLKSGQEYILAVRISRQGWEEALALAALTDPDKRVYRDHDDWQTQFAQAREHVQWDTERTMRGAALPYKSIQMGLSRHIIEKYVNDWTLEINNYTPLVRKLYQLIQSGQSEKAKKLLPPERSYPLDPQIGKRIGLSL